VEVGVVVVVVVVWGEGITTGFVYEKVV